MLLGKDINDLDFAVEGDAFLLSTLIALELGGEVINHPQFMTASVIVEDIRIDIATSRKEFYPSYGMLPQVVPGFYIGRLIAKRFFNQCHGFSSLAKTSTIVGSTEWFD